MPAQGRLTSRTTIGLESRPMDKSLATMLIVVGCLISGIGPAGLSPKVLSSDFESEVAPLLIRRCLECHKGTEPAGGLSLESMAGFAAGGDSGELLDHAKPLDSLILQRVADGEMPPPLKGVPQPLSDAEQLTLRSWVQQGAPWPAARALDLYEVTTDVRGGRDWWAFQPLVRPIVPQAASRELRNPIDAFIQHSLEQRGMDFAPTADSRTLVRRLYVDLTGLPPSYEEVMRWTKHSDELKAANGESADDFNELIEELLDSPHFGERWGRYWLDLVRYAETSGYERDQEKLFAWKYRDWVIQAINDDMPYDQFIREQVAGDELSAAAASDDRQRSLIATGFLRLGTWNDEPNDDAEYRYERLEDIVHATSSAFLALTVKCARCHDHKFDPIPQVDYYRMAAAFWPGPIAARDRALLGGPSAEELGVENVLGWTDLSASPPPLNLLKNGEYDKPQQAVGAASLSFAPQLFCEFPTPELATTTQRRLQLAKWLASPKNPLTARVYVNRLWQHHFGEGLVRSPNNFGYKGDLPTHPELLDWLASELIESGWSAKHIHRLILSSRTWRQSTLNLQAEQYNRVDSTNRYWWRFNRRRLDADALRDAMLVASGEIDLRFGGESLKATISAEALEGLSRKGDVWSASPVEEQHRRSVYMFVSRSLMQPMMTSFDQPDTTLPCAQRDVTTVAPQALAMLNNDFTLARSQALASRARKIVLENKNLDDEVSDQALIDAVWRIAFGREPSAIELQLASEHLATQRQQFTDAAEMRAWESLCQVVLISNEFLYVD